jgi:hypothetical protein
MTSLLAISVLIKKRGNIINVIKRCIHVFCLTNLLVVLLLTQDKISSVF